MSILWKFERIIPESEGSKIHKTLRALLTNPDDLPEPETGPRAVISCPRTNTIKEFTRGELANHLQAALGPDAQFKEHQVPALRQALRAMETATRPCPR